ncbi:MAG: putative transcription regulator [uncultured bacterium (gcode 4)]|uniref:Putative transcription regulator n=1 Tax=uncultured bacterium (gcode 4) TaxID=1234023 RepID=K2FFB1_9BACT|nr:MAG: putative transcription regulator [uncultured bacterium (gcode 4)]
MSFKKYKIKKIHEESIIDTTLQTFKDKYHKAKRKNFLSGMLLWLIWVSAVVFLWMFTFSKLSSFSLDFSFLNLLNVSWLSSIDPTKEKINVLLTWVWGWSHEWWDLTDTIILASINTKKKTVSMLSLPRDLYVTYPGWDAWRINELYMKGKKRYSESQAMKDLKDKVEQITGEKADYFLNIDFNWFIKFVDLLGWIEVDVPKDLTDTEYPDNNYGYETFSIKKWKQVLSWTVALKYARSRHSTSDFDRSLRQQLVIKSIKTKLLNLNYIGSPTKLKALFFTLNSNIKTDMWIKEIINIAALAKEIPNKNIFSFNLNNSCEWWLNTCDIWWFLYTPERAAFWWASVVLPDEATSSNVSKYNEITKFANMVFNYPEIYVDKPEINFVNSTKVSWLANRFAVEFKKFWFNVPDKDSILSTKEKVEKTKIYYVWDDKAKVGLNPQNKVLEAIWQFLFCDQEAQRNLQYSKNPGTKIEIVLGSDYKLFLND